MTAAASPKPLESEVIAAGHINGEPGRGSFIAPGTVKTHLERILAKLGVRGRAELATEVARRIVE